MIFLIIKERLALYGVDVANAVPHLDIDVRPITKLRLHEIIAYCIYEYKQSLNNQAYVERSSGLWVHHIGSSTKPQMLHLVSYARNYARMCMPDPQWRVELSYRDADGVDDVEDAKDRAESRAALPQAVIPPRQFES